MIVVIQVVCLGLLFVSWSVSCPCFFLSFFLSNNLPPKGLFNKLSLFVIM